MEKLLDKIWNVFMVYEEEGIDDFSFGYVPGAWYLRRWACWVIIVAVFTAIAYLTVVTRPA